MNESLLERLARCEIKPIQVVRGVFLRGECPPTCSHLVKLSTGEPACQIISGAFSETDCPCFADAARSMVERGCGT